MSLSIVLLEQSYVIAFQYRFRFLILAYQNINLSFSKIHGASLLIGLLIIPVFADVCIKLIVLSKRTFKIQVNEINIRYMVALLLNTEINFNETITLV